jgi:alkanesulfonate monooxygenase SsuD/methylene tetrahydromethanopterin reductase-like flavin-dependent oxidoreductase (luciferase family)
MRFSLHSVHGGVRVIDEIHRRAQRVEELGYDGIFLGESHLSSITPSKPSPVVRC